MCDCPHIITHANRHQKQGCIAHSAIPVTRVVKLRTFRSLKTRSPLPRSISITSAVDSASQMASCRGFGLSDGLLQRAGGSSFDPPASLSRPSGAPSLSRPRPARTLPPDLYRIHECKAWDERAVHLMRSSSRVQDYLRKEGSYSLATRAAEQTLGTRSNKRRRESQDRRSVKRPSLATPTDAYRAIFARSSLLRQRFSALATS